MDSPKAKEQHWEKQGLVFPAASYRRQPWAVSHGQLPTPIALNKDTLRVYTAFRDENTVSRIGYVDLSLQDPTRILRVSETPVLDIGRRGLFDENGVMPISCVVHHGLVYLYYTGWQLGHRVRYYLFDGLAISEDNGETFHRYSEVPVLDRCDEGLYFRTASYVLFTGETWQMWYVAGSEWTNHQGKEVPVYRIYTMESADGKTWGNHGALCIDFKDADEHGFGRPFVLHQNGIYRMWYSIRTFSQGYGMGYAESADGILWQRLDECLSGLAPSAEGWDSEMICYGAVVQTGTAQYMFYNGNNFGEAGFGLAVLST